MVRLVRSSHAFRSIPSICALVCAISLIGAAHADAATIAVPADGNLQSALNAAQPGDVITLAPGATYTGNFVLPDKGPITKYIVIRSAAPDSALPPAGIRMTPAYSAWLPKIKSGNNSSALRTAPSANHWKLMFLEFQANQNGYGEIIALGAGDSTQTQLSQVPHHLVLDRVYVHGDPVRGQKRGIALNSSDTSIINSYISDCKAVGQDSQAIQGHNGPGNYLIENNYLEAAAENFLLGGADPPMSNLVTSNVLFRRNYLSKPLAWRDPIAPTASNVTAVTGTGSLAAGTYGYRVVSRVIASQGVKAVSAASAEIQVTIASGTTRSVVLTWSAVPGAIDYLVYGRTPAAQNMFWTTTATTFVDTGAAGTAGTPPSKGTRWVVKNLFELKNARDVTVEGNVMENLWVADQTGYAMLLTPRNQGGHAPWATVERVTVRGNLVRNVAGGVNILGRDNVYPSQLTNHINVHDNLFDDLLSEIWGTGSRPFLLGDGPDSVTMDHNTIITTDSSILYAYGGSATSPTQVTNMSYTNNMSRHNTYGIAAANFTSGLPTILNYMPDAVVTGNVLAGGTASKYPAGNWFPTTAQWENDFIDYAGGDYRLATTSTYKAIGTDSRDLGANIGMVTAHAARALAGDVTDSPSDGPNGPDSVPPLTILTTALQDGTVSVLYGATLAASGGAGNTRWALVSGSLPDGIEMNEFGRIEGFPASAATFTFTVQAYDAAVPPNTASRSLSIEVAPTAVVIVTPTVPDATVAVAYSAPLSATGGAGGYLWSAVGGALPPGLMLTTTGTITGTPTTPGTFTVTVQAADKAFPQNQDTASFSIAVSAPPFTISIPTPPAGIIDQPYQLTASASGQIGVVTWSIVSGGLPPGITLDVATGLMAGSPAAAGTFTAIVRGKDTGTVTRTDDASVTIVVAAKVSIVTAALPAGNVGSPYAVVLTATGSTGPVVWSVAGGSLPAGLVLGADGRISGRPTALGTATFTVRAADSDLPANVAARSFTLTVGAREIVLYTSAAKIVGNAWSRVADATAANGSRVWNRDRGSERIRTAYASPSSYVEITFQAEAGVAYHLWLRAIAERNSVYNDSVHVQFSGSVDAGGSAIDRIGTRQSASVILEDGSGAYVHGWGWNDNQWGAGVLGTPIYFQTSGLQTLRLQQREDGVSIDQIVLSAVTYVAKAPGALEDDTVILPR
jgi:hypothetical protein